MGTRSCSDLRVPAASATNRNTRLQARATPRYLYTHNILYIIYTRTRFDGIKIMFAHSIHTHIYTHIRVQISTCIMYICIRDEPAPFCSRVRDPSKRSTAVCLRSWTLFSVYLREREY